MADDSLVPSGTFTSIGEAEAAVGFSIPHARNPGRFSLGNISVRGGTRQPGNTGEPRVGDYGHDRTEFFIFLTYHDGPEPRTIRIFISPRTDVALQEPTGSEPLVHGRPVVTNVDPRVINPTKRADVTWVDRFEFHASTLLESSRVPGQGISAEELRAATTPVPGIPVVTLQEFLDLVASVR